VYEKKEKERIIEIDRSNYNLGKYVGMAVNASDKHPYPTKSFYEKAEEERKMEKRGMSDKQMAARMKANFSLYMGLRKKNSKEKK